MTSGNDLSTQLKSTHVLGGTPSDLSASSSLPCDFSHVYQVQLESELCSEGAQKGLLCSKSSPPLGPEVLPFGIS